MSNLAKSVETWAKKNMADIERGWGKSTIDGEAEIKFEIVDDSPNEITGRFTASGQKMWMNEYGSGSKLDRSNPFLSQYTSSSVFNKERLNETGDFKYAIRTRPSGHFYQDLDGNNHRGSGIGMPHGLRLESKSTFGNLAVDAHEPKHTIQETLTGSTAYNEQFKQDLLSSFGATVKESIAKVVHEK